MNTLEIAEARKMPVEQETFRHIFDPSSSVVAVVDNMVALCSRHHVALSATPRRCTLRPATVDGGAGNFECLEIDPLNATLLRAVLARLVALCNSGRQKPISPYGGNGWLVVNSETSARVDFEFVNTPSDQQLELVPSRTVEPAAPRTNSLPLPTDGCQYTSEVKLR